VLGAEGLLEAAHADLPALVALGEVTRSTRRRGHDL
jgi:hypothetical protein